ncbi:hypothetical protein DFJ65_0314 [Calidifontibacter indicus]|uniref:Uncharacterized protein n=1 Tax=Calidifontibacter indicus TaxID=419650 RepID=A0A3D9UTR2_9MICO|nr:hypothetical protein DFJ65_0314 [Calidifontibacter indicus]
MGGGSLYRVTVQDFELDDDFKSLNGVALQAPQARVVEVAIRTVGFDQQRCLRIIKHHLAQHEIAKRRRIPR